MLAHREQSICHIESNLFCGSMTKILSTMTKMFMVSLVCLFVFLTACWRSSSRRQIESYLFATVWERSSAQWQNFAWFSLVCLCALLILKLKTGESIFIEVLGCCGPHKLLLQCDPYKRILCWGCPDCIIRTTIHPTKSTKFRLFPDYIIWISELHQNLLVGGLHHTEHVCQLFWSWVKSRKRVFTRFLTALSVYTLHETIPSV